ncbi:hypothetical protein BC834DRAFT_965476 [Gloeopeniophorella convolvens]|nr:hypothetical protein BC834DRAFT_965476 [Gloeopeniophorella convolvens]
MPPARVHVHVHFPALLARPPAGRARKPGLVYPALAQTHGSGDRARTPDLFWGHRPIQPPAPAPAPAPAPTPPRREPQLVRARARRPTTPRSDRAGGARIRVRTVSGADAAAGAPRFLSTPVSSYTSDSSSSGTSASDGRWASDSRSVISSYTN